MVAGAGELAHHRQVGAAADGMHEHETVSDGTLLRAHEVRLADDDALHAAVGVLERGLLGVDERIGDLLHLDVSCWLLRLRPCRWGAAPNPSATRPASSAVRSQSKIDVPLERLDVALEALQGMALVVDAGAGALADGGDDLPCGPHRGGGRQPRVDPELVVGRPGRCASTTRRWRRPTGARGGEVADRGRKANLRGGLLRARSPSE